MDIDIKILIQLYKEEIDKLQNENLILKAQLIQMKKNVGAKVESGEDE